MLIWLDGARSVHPEWQICAEHPADDPGVSALAATVQVGDTNRAPLRGAPIHWIWDVALGGWAPRGIFAMLDPDHSCDLFCGHRAVRWMCSGAITMANSKTNM